MMSTREGRTRHAGLARSLVVALASGAMIAAGVLPAAAAEKDTGSTRPKAPSWEEVFGGPQNGSGQNGSGQNDPRRRAELDGQLSGDRPDPKRTKPVPVTAVRGNTNTSGPSQDQPPPWSPGTVEWPQQGKATVELQPAGDAPSGKGRGSRAGDLPVWVSAAGPDDAAAGSSVTVEVLDREAAARAGGVVAVRLRPEGGGSQVGGGRMGRRCGCRWTTPGSSTRPVGTSVPGCGSPGRTPTASTTSAVAGGVRPSVWRRPTTRPRGRCRRRCSCRPRRRC